MAVIVWAPRPAPRPFAEAALALLAVGAIVGSGLSARAMWAATHLADGAWLAEVAGPSGAPPAPLESRHSAIHPLQFVAFYAHPEPRPSTRVPAGEAMSILPLEGIEEAGGSTEDAASSDGEASGEEADQGADPADGDAEDVEITSFSGRGSRRFRGWRRSSTAPGMDMQLAAGPALVFGADTIFPRGGGTVEKGRRSAGAERGRGGAARQPEPPDGRAREGLDGADPMVSHGVGLRRQANPEVVASTLGIGMADDPEGTPERPHP